MILKSALKFMDLVLNKKIFYYLITLLGFELLAALVYFWPGLNSAIFILIIIAALILTVYRLEYGLLLIIAELIIGSMGHIMSFSGLSLRLALFLIIMAVWFFNFLRQPRFFLAKLKTFKIIYFFLALFLFFALGVAQGFWHYGLSANVFLDLNGWLFFALLLPFISVYYQNSDRRVYSRLATVALAAVIWLGLKTLFFFYIFSHDYSFAPLLYKWIRQSGVGEITNIGFNWPRIFLQSQIYAGLAFIMLLFWRQVVPRTKKIIYYSLLTLFLMTVLISFSRSFWVGLAVAYIFSAILLIRQSSWRAWLKSLPGLLLSALASLVLIYLIAFFPWPKTLVSFSTDIFSRRANFLSEEAAIASRWSLLQPLWQKVKEQTLLGQGFGTTITYKSSDPRILQNNPSGKYTTYAFEWGYLDIWLKIGLLGVLAYLVLLGRLIKSSFKAKEPVILALAAGLIFLAVTNIFTPYLNHPLGISYILLSSCLIF